MLQTPDTHPAWIVFVIIHTKMPICYLRDLLSWAFLYFNMYICSRVYWTIPRKHLNHNIGISTDLLVHPVPTGFIMPVDCLLRYVERPSSPCLQPIGPPPRTSGRPLSSPTLSTVNADPLLAHHHPSITWHETWRPYQQVKESVTRASSQTKSSIVSDRKGD